MRSPDAIVTVASVEDVSRSVKFAREQGLKVAVRGSGHNYFGAPLRDEGLLLNLERLQKIEVHAEGRRARLQPAVKSGRFLSALIPHGLGFPVGHSADVGLSGFLLNGGMGWNIGQWGPACASVTGVEVVLASAEPVYADAQQYSDLLWAARGAGAGFFGVITAYDVAVYPLPTGITVEAIAFDISSLETVAPWLDVIIATAPPDVEITITLSRAEDQLLAVSAPALSVEAVSFTATSDAQAWMSALHESPPEAQVIGRERRDNVAFCELLRERADKDGKPRMTGDAFWSNTTITRLMATVRPLMSRRPPEHSYLMIQPIKRGAAQMDGGAFSIAGPLYIAAYSYWKDAAQDRQCCDWIGAVR